MHHQTVKMSTCVSSKSSFQLLASSIKLEEEAPRVTIEKQGIVSILGTDSETTKAAASLRRTLSADMSSKKWLAQNGFTSFSPMKKIASSEELALSAADHHHSSSSSSSSEGEEEYYEGNKNRPAQDDVWRSIQSRKEKRQQPDVWSWGSILSQKNGDSSKLPPPYVHPLVKRSASSLSEKSLEICTESLGSETGSDGFSSYPPSEVGDVDEEKDNDRQQPQLQLSQSCEDMQIVKYHYSTSSRKSGPRSFPPPLPSLAREDRTSVHMHSHRGNGRLVLEAVSVPPQNYFQAQREDGRLRLTFINTSSSQEEEMEDEVQEFEQVFDNFEEIEENGGSKFNDQGDNKGHEEDEEEEEEEEEVVVVVVKEEEDGKVFKKEKGRREVEIVMEQNSRLPGGLMDVHKPTLMMKKLMGLDKKNLAWAPRFNKAVNLEEVEVVDAFAAPPLPQSLPVPPPPRVPRLISSPPATSAAASFNAYEYFWKEKPTMASIIKPISTAEKCQPLKSNQNKVIIASNVNSKGYEQQNLVLMRGNKAEYLVPLLGRCNASRARSLLRWEPYCIATS